MEVLRLYEAAGILSAPRRTASGYRVHGADMLDLLAFVRQAQRLGLSLEGGSPGWSRTSDFLINRRAGVMSRHN